MNLSRQGLPGASAFATLANAGKNPKLPFDKALRPGKVSVCGLVQKAPQSGNTVRSRTRAVPAGMSRGRGCVPSLAHILVDRKHWTCRDLWNREGDVCQGATHHGKAAHVSQLAKATILCNPRLNHATLANRQGTRVACPLLFGAWQVCQGWQTSF